MSIPIPTVHTVREAFTSYGFPVEQVLNNVKAAYIHLEKEDLTKIHKIYLKPVASEH